MVQAFLEISGAEDLSALRAVRMIADHDVAVFCRLNVRSLRILWGGGLSDLRNLRELSDLIGLNCFNCKILTLGEPQPTFLSDVLMDSLLCSGSMIGAGVSCSS